MKEHASQAADCRMINSTLIIGSLLGMTLALQSQPRIVVAPEELNWEPPPGRDRSRRGCESCDYYGNHWTFAWGLFFRVAYPIQRPGIAGYRYCDQDASLDSDRHLFNLALAGWVARPYRFWRIARTTSPGHYLRYSSFGFEISVKNKSRSAIFSPVRMHSVLAFSNCCLNRAGRIHFRCGSGLRTGSIMQMS